MSTINKALECALPLFLRCKPFLEADRGATLTTDFRDRVVADFVALEQQAFSLQVDASHVEHIKYALAAFIDEAVMSSLWPQRLEWMGRPLQLQFFGEHLAGEGFFTRLSMLRQSGIAQTDLLEVYYVCLQLGFQGMYRMRGPEHLQALQVGLKSQIESARGVIDPCLSPNGIPLNNLIKDVGREVPFWVIGIVTFTLIFFIYLGYSFAINAQADKAFNRVHADRMLLPLSTTITNQVNW